MQELRHRKSLQLCRIIAGQWNGYMGEAMVTDGIITSYAECKGHKMLSLRDRKGKSNIYKHGKGFIAKKYLMVYYLNILLISDNGI